MTNSLNECNLLGNVGRDVEIRTLQGGKKVANLTLATTKKWTDKTSGEKKSLTEWHRITAWGPVVDIIEKYVKKGSRLFIKGELQTHEYEQDGVKKHSTEVVVQGYGGQIIILDKPSETPLPAVPQRVQSAPQQQKPQSRDRYDDDIPF